VQRFKLLPTHTVHFPFSFSSQYHTRNELSEANTLPIKAQAVGTPILPGLSSNANYLENDAAMAFSKGALSQAVTIDLSRSLIDTTQCASNKKPYAIHTRMLFSADGSQITGIQTVLAKDGDWAFNAAGQLKCAYSFLHDPSSSRSPHFFFSSHDYPT
jgi:hypothetical protein